MDITAIELDFTSSDGDGEDTALGGLAGLCFLVALTLADRWTSRDATTDK